MSFFPTLIRRNSYVGEPKTYTYRKYKAEISEDCVYRCVYCDCHCNSFGGHNLMELDHFRPKTKTHFPELKDDPTNLVLACRSCNGKKRDDWPAKKESGKTHENGLGYVDPFHEERVDYFTVEELGTLTAKENPADYMIEQLALNRPFAVAVRARRFVRGKLHTAIADLVEEGRRIGASSNQASDLVPIWNLLGQANRELEQLELEDSPPL